MCLEKCEGMQSYSTVHGNGYDQTGDALWEGNVQDGSLQNVNVRGDVRQREGRGQRNDDVPGHAGKYDGRHGRKEGRL